VRVSPSTRFFPLLAGVLFLASTAVACGEPPQAAPTSPTYVPDSAASGAVPPPVSVITTQPALVPTPATYPAYPTAAYPTYPAGTPTTAPTTTAPTIKSPTPTPSHAAKCSGEPTGAEILALINGQEGIPTDPLKVDSGPFCSGTWSFTTVQISGKNDDQLEPLMVVAIGKGTSIGLVGAGSDVCSDRVQTDAPSGIRVLACGF
jgi:hypothetical protein